MSSTNKQPPIIKIICNSNSEQPFPERTLKLDPTGQPTLIGRATASDKDSKNSANPSSLANPENAKFICSVMSRTHAQLTWINNRLYLQDTGSTHGTWYTPPLLVSKPPDLAQPRRPHTSGSLWEKIPNPLALQDGVTIRFGRAITNPLNGSRHAPLQVTFRIPPAINSSQSGTYGLKGSQYLDSSDEGDHEDKSPSEHQSIKLGSHSIDSSRLTVTSNQDSSQAQPNPPNHSGIESSFLEPHQILDPVESTFDHRLETQKPSKRSVLSSNPDTSSANHPSQLSKKSGHHNNDSLPPSYEQCQQPHSSHQNPSGDPSCFIKPTQPHYPCFDGEANLGKNPDSNHIGHENQEGCGDVQEADHIIIEEENSDLQQDISDIAENHQDVQHGNGNHNIMHINSNQDDLSEDDHDLEEEADNIEKENSSHGKDDVNDAEEESSHEEDSQELSDEQEASGFETLKDPASKQPGRKSQIGNQNDEEILRKVAVSNLDEYAHPYELSPPTSTEEVGSPMTTSEEERGTKKHKNQFLARPSYKDVSVVTTITSKTKFTDSSHRLPESLKGTFQVSFKLKPPHPPPSSAEAFTEHHASNRLPIVQNLSKKSPKLNRLVQSEPENVPQLNQIPLTEHPPTPSEYQSPALINDGSIITELKRKRARSVEGEKEQEASMANKEVTESEKFEEDEEEEEGERSKKRVRLAKEDRNKQGIVCSHCSNKIKGNQSKRLKLRSHVASAARTVAIFALGGVATVAGILAFENILDEQL